jgi:hypothetical protein
LHVTDANSPQDLAFPCHVMLLSDMSL